ncbi:potassium transporter TrkA [Halobacteria archaeon HArc-gm2]|nr:potassium transporter TrkA [Halobacteria archaeon HArc-gm2]
MSIPSAGAFTSAGTVAQLGGPTTEGVTVTVAGVIGVAVVAGAVAGAVALAYRWYVRERVPAGLSLLAGLAVVAVSLSTTTLLAEEIAPDGRDIALATALVHVAAFLISGLAAAGGTRFGDRLGVDLFAATGVSDVDADVSEIVQTVGRVTTVQLPEEVADIVGYDPVSEETKETLSERRFLFPRRLSKTELRERLVARLKTDYGVGHVDVEFGDDGSVEFLAVGSRAAGIGPTLPPATNAVAIRADPAHAAGAGDLVQVWKTDPVKRVLTGELRGVAGDVVTVAIDAADTPKLNPTDRYKLVTLPVQDRPDREFASLLRSADETLATVTVAAGSDLDGVSVDALDVTVAAITREDERPEPLPARDRTLQPGDVVYAIATPDNLRKVETAGRGPAGDDAPAAVGDAGDSDDGGPGPTPVGDIGTGTADDSDAVPENDAVPESDAFPDTDDLPGTDRQVDVSGDGPAAETVAEGDATSGGEAETAADGAEQVDGVDSPGEDADGGRGDESSPEEPEGDDAVPFTTLDVGEDDPLSDPLLGGNGDSESNESDGAPDDGREDGDAGAANDAGAADDAGTDDADDRDAVTDDADGSSDEATDDADGEPER